MREPLSTFDLTHPNGEIWRGAVYEVSYRFHGRRIVVQSERGVVLYDSRECIDAANALAGLREWWAEIRAATKGSDVANALAEFAA